MPEMRKQTSPGQPAVWRPPPKDRPGKGRTQVNAGVARWGVGREMRMQGGQGPQDRGGVREGGRGVRSDCGFPARAQADPGQVRGGKWKVERCAGRLKSELWGQERFESGEPAVCVCQQRADGLGNQGDGGGCPGRQWHRREQSQRQASVQGLGSSRTSRILIY